MLTIAIALCAILNVQAKKITVSENFTTPADYENLQEAINAAIASDTIYVSLGSYGDIRINKKLTLIGVGFDINNYSYIDEITFINSIDQNSTLGTIIKGFNIDNFKFSTASNTNTFGKTFKNLFFSRCKFRDSNYFNPNYIYNGFNFRNCVFTDGGTANLLGSGSHFNHIFENCYIEKSYVYYTTGNTNRDYFNIIFRNCILDRNIADNAKGITIENSIILSPFGTKASTLTDNLFNNNLFTGSGITGLDASNIVNANPLFENRTGEFSRYNNYRLKEGSPAKGKGTNGTDIGMFGGNYPFEDYSSSIPRIISLRGENDVNQIKAGERLKIEIVAEANSNN